MNKNFTILKTILFCTIVFAAEQASAQPTLRKPKTKKVVTINRTTTVNGLLDCKGATYRWTGSGSCGQKEGMPPMFLLSQGATLKNCFIVNAPDGVHIQGSNVTITNIVMPDVCEDAVSVRPKVNYTNIKITYSQFAKCADKCIQFNPKGIKKLTLANNDFMGGGSCVRFKGGADVTASNNKFANCKRGFYHSEGKAKLHLSGNKYYNVGTPVKTEGGLTVSGKD